MSFFGEEDITRFALNEQTNVANIKSLEVIQIHINIGHRTSLNNWK